jgi:hypothetical protein
MDHDTVLVHGGLVVVAVKGSPEHSPLGAQGSRSSSRLHKNGEEIDAVLTEVKIGHLNDG